MTNLVAEIFMLLKFSSIYIQDGPEKRGTTFYFCNNFRKCTPILIIFHC